MISAYILINEEQRDFIVEEMKNFLLNLYIEDYENFKYDSPRNFFDEDPIYDKRIRIAQEIIKQLNEVFK